jgi:hypothetical protein
MANSISVPNNFVPPSELPEFNDDDGYTFINYESSTLAQSEKDFVNSTKSYYFSFMKIVFEKLPQFTEKNTITDRVDFVKSKSDPLFRGISYATVTNINDIIKITPVFCIVGSEQFKFWFLGDGEDFVSATFETTTH